VTGAAARVVVVAEMQGRDLARRHVAMALLVALPVCFYGALAGQHETAIIPGGIAMAFSIGGAAIFSVLSSRPVDQRLALTGFRPAELLLGRVLFLDVLSLPVVAGTAALMALVSQPGRPWILGLAVAMVALIAVPFGLAIGALVPNELEATLVLIGVVGIQLSLDANAPLGRFLPFWGPRRLLDVALGEPASVLRLVAVCVGYAAVLSVIALWFMGRRLAVRRHPAVR
jgi:hypothetical protein